jgi:arsenical pump membrane protein
VLPDGTTHLSLLVIALVATMASLLVTNLSATLLLVPLLAPLGTPAVLAALVGLNAGAGLTWSGSLATMLWRRGLTREGRPPTSRDFHRVSLALTPVTVLVATAAIAVGA